MKRLLTCCILAACALSTPAEIPFLDAGIDVEANKNLYDDSITDNFDVLFGRLYISPHYESEKFEGKIQVYIYPAGFGYQVLRGAEMDPIGEVITESEQIANVQVWEAWGKVKGKMAAWSFGHLLTYNGRGYYFGNYLDEDNGGWFCGKGLFTNASELAIDPSETDHLSILLGTDDTQLNSGYLRIFNELTLAEKFVIGVGYRTNIFDRVYDSHATVKHHAALNLAADITENFSVYAEAGFRNMGGDGQEKNLTTPLMLGVNIPTKGILDGCNAEIEFFDGPEKDLVNYSLYLKKAIGEHVSVQTGLWTVGKAAEPVFGIRLNAGL